MIDCLKSCATALIHLWLSVSVHGEVEKKFAQCVAWLCGGELTLILQRKNCRKMNLSSEQHTLSL